MDIDPRNPRAIAELVPPLDGAGVRLRLVPGLKTEATAYARSIGISFNALCAVALREYLDQRKKLDGLDAAPTTGRGRSDSSSSPASTSPANGVVAKVGANQPCPCGSGKKYKKCHGAIGAGG